MRARIVVIFVAVVGLFIGLMSGQAAAFSPGVAFSATAAPTWQTNGVVYAMGASHGKVIAGGTFSQIRPPDGAPGSPQGRNALAIFDAQTGNPDSCQFNVTLSGGTPTVRAISTSDDGETVYIGGNFSHINGAVRLRAAALDVESCTVRPFRVNSISSFVYGLGIHQNTLYLAGAFQSVEGQQRLRFAAVNATTGDLLPFVANADDTGRAIAVSPDGSKVALGGDIFSINGEYSHSIAMVDAVTGANLRTYPEGFIPRTSVTKDIFSGEDGRFYISNEGTGGGVFDGRAAFDWDTGDQVWRDNCLGATQATFVHQGTLYSASHAHTCEANGGFPDGRRNFFLAQSAETAELYGWYPNANDGIGEGIGPRDLVVATGRNGQEYLWFGGEFTRINGDPQQSLTRFDTINHEGPDTPNPEAEAMSDGSIQVRIPTEVDPDDSVLTYRVYRNGSSTPIWEGQSTSVWWKQPQVTFVDRDVEPGTWYGYRVSVSDGVNTSNLSPIDAATATTPTTDYVSTVRADNPQSLWSAVRRGDWIQDRGANTTNPYAQPAQAEEGVGNSADSPLPGDSTGSLSFDGTDDYLWNDNYAPGPNTYSVEAWFRTDTDRGGKIIGYGNGRPRTNTGDARVSGSYDRHIYMENGGRLRFGIWTGSAQTVRSSEAYNDNQWHHVVGTQGPSGLALYVDGLRVGTNSATTAQDYWGVWHVGGDNINGWPNNPSSRYFDGLIDEVAIYDRPLAPRTVANHFQASGRTLDVNESPSDAYGAAVFAQDPSLYWRLDETSGSFADSSYFGQNTGVSGLLVTRGAEGIVDGNNAIVTPANPLGTVATQQPGGTPAEFTAQVWFRTTTNSGGKLFGFENTQTGNGTNYDKHLYMSNGGQLNFGTWIGGHSVVTTGDSYNDGAWHRATAVLDSTGTKLYVDGQLEASNGTTNSQNFTGYWRLGGGSVGSWPNSGSSEYFAGTLDEFAVYPTGLSAGVIGNQYGIGIADDEPPTTPADLSASTTAQGVQLSWSASTDNVGVSDYRVHRGGSAGFTPSDANLITETEDLSYLDESAGAGEHFYRIVAVDTAGNRSNPSASVSATVADTEAPSTPADVTAEQAGADVELGWSAATDNVGVTGYRVHRGSTAGFTPGAGNLITEVTGTSYTDADPGPGDYFYKIIAVDGAGNSSAPSAATGVTVTAPDTTPPGAPTGLTATASQTRVDLDWTAATDDTGVTGYRVHRSTNAGFTPGDGNLIAEVTGLEYADTGLAEGTYYYRVTAVDAAGNIGDASAEVTATVEGEPAEPTTITVPVDADAAVRESLPNNNYGGTNQIWSRGESGQESFLSVQLPEAPAGTVLTDASLELRTSTDPVAGSTDTHRIEIVSGAWTEAGVTWNNRPTTVVAPVGTISGATQTNTPVSVPATVGSLQDALGSTITLRISGTGSDNLRLWSSETSNADYRPELILTFTEAGTDSEAPTTPTGLTASSDQDTVTLDWNASDDNVGVAEYTVYRGGTAGFPVGAATAIGTTGQTAFTDQGLAPGSYFYKVTARDAEGNVSAPTAAVEGTASEPQEPVEPVEVQIIPDADAAVRETAPNANYGGTNQVWSRGDTAQQAFLSFAIPEAPAGTELTAASLQLRTSTDPVAGSTDDHQISIITGAWTESGLTWNNRPTTVAANGVGTVSGATATNTPYVIECDPALLAARAGATVTLRISSTGTDNLRLWSTEGPADHYRPMLDLSFTPAG